jgi:spore coat protein H
MAAALLAMGVLAAACSSSERPADRPDAGQQPGAGESDAGPNQADADPGVTDEPGGKGGPTAEDLATVFDDSKVRTYELTLADADWAFLNEDPVREQYVPATLRVDGEQYGPIGVRYKGDYSTLQSCFSSTGQRLCPKLSVKLKFDKYQDDLRFYRLKRLNLHAMRTDVSQMRDRLAYHLFREMGLPTPHTAYARLVVNGELLGLFELVEQVDGRFTANRFPNDGDGNLYKETWPMYGEAAPYLAALKTNDDQKDNPDVSRMVKFDTEIAAATTDAEIAAVVQSWVDVDQWARYLAVDEIISNLDGVTVWYCKDRCRNHNFYLYEESQPPRFSLVPWDVDQTFYIPDRTTDLIHQHRWDQWPVSCELVPIPNTGGTLSVRAPACDPVIRVMSTQFADQVAAARAQFLAGPFKVETIHARINAWAALIESAVAEDPVGPGLAAWQNGVVALRSAVEELRRLADAGLKP